MSGVISLELGLLGDGLQYLEAAYSIEGPRDAGITANYIEVLRRSGNALKARDIGHRSLEWWFDNYEGSGGAGGRADVAPVYVNLAVVEKSLGDGEAAMRLVREALALDRKILSAWKLGAEILQQQQQQQQRWSLEEAELFLAEALEVFPAEGQLHFMLGTVAHHQSKLDLALRSYLAAEALDGSIYSVKGSIAVVLQTMGRYDEALHYYELALAHRAADDASLLNNYATLLGILGDKEGETTWLEATLSVDPSFEQALLNLARSHQIEGNISRAAEYISHLKARSDRPQLLDLRIALLLSPVTESWTQMLQQRSDLTRLLLDRRMQDSNGRSKALSSSSVERHGVDESLEKLDFMGSHFYVSYHGLNDRYLQELVVSLYHSHLTVDYTASHLLLPADDGSESDVVGAGGPPTGRKVKVGFLSKFFSIFEPHGMLLDGVMKYLPRDRFEVYGLPVSQRSKPMSPTIRDACDFVFEVSLNYRHAQSMVEQLQLDVLIFADTMSEPMTHFLAHSRLAPLQVPFNLSCPILLRDWLMDALPLLHHNDYCDSLSLSL